MKPRWHRFGLLGGCVLGILLAALVWWGRTPDPCADAVAPPEQHAFYVAPRGSGTACTLACPCAFRTALGLMQTPGMTLYLRGGTYDFSQEETP